jgi:predicted O-methyltransferase YrrM
MNKDNIIKEINKNWIGRHFSEDQRDFFIDLLLDLKPEYCLETGFASGTSSATVLATCKPKKMISVSLANNAMNIASNLEKEYNFKLIIDNSIKILQNSFFEKEFTEGIDFYFVDGGHSYNETKNDLNSGFPYMNPDSIIIVDDYYSKVCHIDAVIKAVDEFVKKHSLNIELINTPDGKGMALIKINKKIN